MNQNTKTTCTIQIGQIWKSYGGDIDKITGDYVDHSDNINPWEFEATVIYSFKKHRQNLIENGLVDFYNVTAEGKFWHGTMSEYSTDVRYNLNEFMSKEENPEYYL